MNKMEMSLKRFCKNLKKKPKRNSEAKKYNNWNERDSKTDLRRPKKESAKLKIGSLTVLSLMNKKKRRLRKSEQSQKDIWDTKWLTYTFGSLRIRNDNRNIWRNNA